MPGLFDRDMTSMDSRKQIIQRVFDTRSENGFWKVICPSDKYYPECLHYVPTYTSTLWTLILLAEVRCDANDQRVKGSLQAIQNQFFNSESGIYCIGKHHFPIPCLNGNMIYLDSYFNGKPGPMSLKALDFFAENQRFDDGVYHSAPNKYCSNKSCYGKHTCYWGITKLLKGISFIPESCRTPETRLLLKRCIDFVLLHKVCYSSRREGKLLALKIDALTFPSMYKSDFLEILWLLKRENVRSPDLIHSLQLLRSKQKADGNWHLERQIHHMVASAGSLNNPNPFISERAEEVLEFYSDL